MGGLWSPHVGKFGGTGGTSSRVPTCSTKFIPMTMWNKKWQWNNQKPVEWGERKKERKEKNVEILMHQ
jgi:hypothetical protein